MSQVNKLSSKKEDFKINVSRNDVLEQQNNISGSISRNTVLKKQNKVSGDLLFKTTNPDKVLELGSLESIFPCSRSKILDFLCVFDKYDYSISDIARYSGISFKTALNEVRILDSEGIIIHTRTAGKAIMYKLNPDSKTAKSINKLALDIAVKHVKENHN